MSSGAEIRKYIAFRYPNWRDYAAHLCRVNNLQGWENDLLDEIIIDLLGKPEEKLSALIGRKTEKEVNGEPTTDLDKFILKTMWINATSQTAPFRKNIIGEKIISRKAGKVEVQHTCELNGHDQEDEKYDPAWHERFEKMHVRNIKKMKKAGYTDEAITLYVGHFIFNSPAANSIQKDAIQEIQNFLTQ